MPEWVLLRVLSYGLFITGVVPTYTRPKMELSFENDFSNTSLERITR